MFIKLLDREPEGKYVIMRDPNRAIVRIYEVPVGTFEEDDSDDDSDDDEEEEAGEEAEE